MTSVSHSENHVRRAHVKRRVVARMIALIGYNNQLVVYIIHFVGVIGAPMLAFGYWSLAGNYGPHGHSLAGSRLNWPHIHASPSALSGGWNRLAGKWAPARRPLVRSLRRLRRRAFSF
jgi:hypothetical protein